MQQKEPKDQQKGDQYPGYPHHPASEDITAAGNNTEQVNVDPDNLSRGTQIPGKEQQGAYTTDDTVSDNPVISNAPSPDEDGNVTDEDREMLAAADQNRDMDDSDLEAAKLDETDEDGDPLNEPRAGYGATGADLDVPGSEDDDADEAIGEEDEENNYYSLGGDNHENLEEDTSI